MLHFLFDSQYIVIISFDLTDGSFHHRYVVSVYEEKPNFIILKKKSTNKWMSNPHPKTKITNKRPRQQANIV